MADRTKDKEQRRKDSARRMREWRAKNPTEYERAAAAGKLDEYRARSERKNENRKARRKAATAQNPPRRGPQPPPVLKVGQLAPVEQAAQHASLAELVEQWGPKVTARYRRSSKGNAFHVFRSALASMPPRPTALEYKAWLSGLRLLGRHSPGTLNRYRETLFTLYEFARLRGGPWINPLVDVEPFKDEQLRKLPITERNVRETYLRCLEVLDDPRDRGLIATLRYTSLRIGEVLALTAGDLDFEGGKIHVTKQREEGYYEPQLLKADRQRRFIRMHPDLAEKLRAVLRLGPAEVKMGNTNRPTAILKSPYLFPHRLKPLRALLRKVQAVVDGLKGSGLAWHAWRHAWALEAYKKARMPIDEISKWMGHSSIFVTEKYLRELMGYDAPVTALERLWAAQSGEPVAVDRAPGIGVLDGEAGRRGLPQGEVRAPATKPESVTVIPFSGRKHKREK